ncbi:MAG TPA: ISNCY family transposase [Verrucomicrobiae bacterium]|nr:ISNCY family transposase [Verrucomicrobiae bacterium]
MTQAERDRLVALKKAQKKLITQKQAAEELGITERHVRRLLRALKRRGDKIVVHALRGLPSNRKISADTEQKAIGILADPVYRGFGPTLAAEHLDKKHGIQVSRETVRQWMTKAKLWRARKQHIEKVHEWRPRRSRFGELVQWDTSDHDWLEGRGEEILLINMIDDATSRWFARFVRSDSTIENMNHLERYLKKHGRPLGFYTDKASLFQTTEKTKRDGSRKGKKQEELPPTQIGRALQELGIPWIAAHSPQAKGRVERGFRTAQDRLVKEMRVAGVKTLEEANRFLEMEFLPWVNGTLAVAPASPDDAHRPLEKHHELAAILSHVEKRRVNNDYSFPLDAKTYRIVRQDICAGLRGSYVRVEQRRDGSVAVRFGDRYLHVQRCEVRMKVESAKPAISKPPRKPAKRSDWMRNFRLKKPGPMRAFADQREETQ